MEKTYQGIAASNGVAIAKIYKIIEIPVNIVKQKVTNTADEINKLNEAILFAKKEVLNIRDLTLKNIGQNEADIFNAHISMLDDPYTIDKVKTYIKDNKCNAAFAYQTTMNQIISEISESKNEYMLERITDIKDITKRVIARLYKQRSNASFDEIDGPVIIVSEDLTPSDTVSFDNKKVKGIITAKGGKTSHSAILARTLNIPAVVGFNDLNKIYDKDLIIIDGTKGKVILDPSLETQEKYLEIQKKYQKQEAIYQKFRSLKTETKDHYHIDLGANIGASSDIDNALLEGAEGVGLFRTEFLYMQSTQMPTEEEQFKAYKDALLKMNPQKVVIRTLDVGGDKNLLYMPVKDELNPFLGYRALRLSLAQKDVFKVQLRALLRASIYGDLHIMFPMVSTLEELREAKEFLEECRIELEKENQEVGTYKVGIMIEVPAAALFVSQFAKEVDFLSIGTNDLIQYLFAADRMNQSVSYLYQPYHPVVFQTIKNIIEQAHKHNVWVGVCGEMGGDPKSALVLAGLGIDELSMNPHSLLEIRYLLSKVTQKELKEFAEKTLEFSTNKESLDYINQFFKTLKS